MSVDDLTKRVVNMAIDPKPCIMCANEEAKMCVSCRSVCCCGPACQKQDWKVHKLLCTKVQSTLANRPSTTHRLAILLPVDDPAPKLVWLDCSEPGHQRDIEALLGKTQSKSTTLQRNVRRGHDIHHSIESRSSITGGTNRCMTSLLQSPENHGAQGTVLFMARQKSSEQFVDITLGDFRVAVDYLFAKLLNECIPISPTRKIPESYVRAVKLNCLGDQEYLREPPYTAVGLRRDSMSYLPQSAAIPGLLGVPLVVHRLHPHPTWKHNENFYNRYDNLSATWLHIDCDPESAQWGWAPRKWQSEVGSIVVARRDGKEISPLQVEALCDYCQRILGSLFEDSVENGMKQPVLQRLTPEAFSRAFEQYKSDMIDSDPRWASEPCPVT